ncbi:TrbG/VirB9 family P-type conjugative transfer protein [Microvirga tunisiensis]|uniref:Conjugal transfer protein n=1 Tax=Microvirga tunisiensis TaxID=2108360 RepID=A0A5N7MPI6_9HYPH|nr:TrbG/VirB9 family P-type conjugative transfer protein [Microvirga tunisiensis]MPR10163.1 conjugal transfer protein [Microvirga tunisiensis]MPR28369.1 conjugal transfer protein [Microvirga tunisiensis]
MYKILCLLLIASVALTTVAMAEQSPLSLPADARIKRFAYDENNVYKLDLYFNSVTAIEFAESEHIEQVFLGESASWDVTVPKRRNVIALKPIGEQALTNMTVYTNQHVYSFELRAVGAIKAGMEAGADQVFRAVFTYPGVIKTLPKSRVEGGRVNRDYMVSGHAQFVPLAVTDNTLQTTFVLSKGAPRPAIFKVGHDGKEKLVNSHTDGERVIVDGTSDYWVMRIGNDIVCVGTARAVHIADPESKY